LRIKCKCLSAKVLSHFIRRAVLYHKMQQQLSVCPCPNTRALLMLVPQSEEKEHTEEEHTRPCPNTAALLMAVRNV
jgi:hypothetical protein